MVCRILYFRCEMNKYSLNVLSGVRNLINTPDNCSLKRNTLLFGAIFSFIKQERYLALLLLSTNNRISSSTLPKKGFRGFRMLLTS